MPATMSSCLNSCWLCGRAYQEPGAGARHQEVASALGVDRVRVGVSISTKSRASSTRRAAADTFERSRMACPAEWGARAAQVEVAVLEPGLLAHGHPLVDLERQRRGGVEHLDRTRRPRPRRWAGRARVALVAGGDLADDLDDVVAAQVVGGTVTPRQARTTHVPWRRAGRSRPRPRVTPLRHPPGEGDGLAGVGGTQGAGLVGAEHRWSFGSGTRLGCRVRRPASAPVPSRPSMEVGPCSERVTAGLPGGQEADLVAGEGVGHDRPRQLPQRVDSLPPSSRPGRRRHPVVTRLEADVERCTGSSAARRRGLLRAQLEAAPRARTGAERRRHRRRDLAATLILGRQGRAHGWLQPALRAARRWLNEKLRTRGASP